MDWAPASAGVTKKEGIMFKGSYVALVTPMRGWRVDEKGLKAWVEYELEKRTGGRVPGAGPGESEGSAGPEAWNRISSPGDPAAAASRASSSPWRDSIQSAKTRDGTETVRRVAPGVPSNRTSRVGSNQVFSSFGSSWSSICLRMEVQISVISVQPDFRRVFHSCGTPEGTRGAGSISKPAEMSHRVFGRIYGPSGM